MKPNQKLNSFRKSKEKRRNQAGDRKNKQFTLKVCGEMETDETIPREEDK